MPRSALLWSFLSVVVLSAGLVAAESATASAAGPEPASAPGPLPASASAMAPPQGPWPAGLVYVGDDCSVYKTRQKDAWGVLFRVDETRAYTEFDLPMPSLIGRRLFALVPAAPGTVPRLLLDAGKGCLGSPSVTFDGQGILVSMAAEGDPFFHIWRVPAEGGEPRRLTGGPYHDLDPAELPDGRIVFASTRAGTFEEYHNSPSRTLFTMQADGSAITQLTFTPLWDNEPKVTADGRIAFVRTDNFLDRCKVETLIHVIHPDGSGGITAFGADVGPEYGNRLRAYGYGSPAPLPDGRLACISNRGNAIAVPGHDEADVQRLPKGLGEVSALPDGRLLCTVMRTVDKIPQPMAIAVLDPAAGNAQQVILEGATAIHSPVFLGARERPALRPSTLIPGATTGFLHCQNARLTRNTTAGWPQVTAMRVLGGVALANRSSHSHIVHAGVEIRELGTVPLAPDGSFSIEVPADMPIALQAVDAEGRSELNQMSWMYVRPGEHRSCIGCHQPRQMSPPSVGRRPAALALTPLKLTGQGAPHRWRGNSAAVNGLMDLQFERFRENASIDLHAAVAPEGGEVAALIAQLAGSDADLRISAAQRLAIFRDPRAAPALTGRLAGPGREERVAAALALATCGTRASVPALVAAVADGDPLVAQAALVALENLTGHRGGEDVFAGPEARHAAASAWTAWLAANPWEAIEADLIRRLAADDAVERRRAAHALGHIAGEAGREALLAWVAQARTVNPYKPYRNDRSDNFTFNAASPLNPRQLQAAVRALGRAGDDRVVPLLAGCLGDNLDREKGNLYLAEAAADALGQVATPAAEQALAASFAALAEYHRYVGWYGDHDALWACHASPVHQRILAALDAMGAHSATTAALIPQIVRSMPTDPDRALLCESDDYENLVGRAVRRCGRTAAVVEACLAHLEGTAKGAKDGDDLLRTHGAWAGKPDPASRAAQVLASVCRDPSYGPRIRAAFARHAALPVDAVIERPIGGTKGWPTRHWVLFFLGRTLGNLGDAAAVETLTTVLAAAPNEAARGRPDPSRPNMHFLHLDYTPCWRASAAWALGRIADPRAAPCLRALLADHDSAPEVRQAAAVALGRLGLPSAELLTLAADEAQGTVRRALEAAAR